MSMCVRCDSNENLEAWHEQVNDARRFPSVHLNIHPTLNTSAQSSHWHVIDFTAGFQVSEDSDSKENKFRSVGSIFNRFLRPGKEKKQPWPHIVHWTLQFPHYCTRPPTQSSYVWFLPAMIGTLLYIHKPDNIGCIFTCTITRWQVKLEWQSNAGSEAADQSTLYSESFDSELRSGRWYGSLNPNPGFGGDRGTQIPSFWL